MRAGQADMVLPPKNLFISELFPFREFSELAVACVQEHPVLVSPRLSHSSEPVEASCTGAGCLRLVLPDKEFQGSAVRCKNHLLGFLQTCVSCFSEEKTEALLFGWYKRDLFFFPHRLSALFVFQSLSLSAFFVCTDED